MFWVKFFFTPPVLVPVALLVGSVILLRRGGGLAAALQIVGCAAYLILFSFDIFIAMSAGHEAITTGAMQLPEWTHHWSLPAV